MKKHQGVGETDWLGKILTGGEIPACYTGIALNLCQNFVSAHYVENKWMDFD